MESHQVEPESGSLGGLFQQILQEMKSGMPLWEELISRALKLHSSLKSTILAVTAYLESFQKIADAATNTKGATRDIGTALTRICLRHKSVETRMKTFTRTIMECLILPLQEKLEDWKKSLVNLDKEHTRCYKRAKSELKKRSNDTLRLQKKARKTAGGEIQKRVESGLQDLTEKRHLLEETEKQAVRAALVEERGRFCTFVGFIKPVVEEEVAMLTEISHLQDAIQQLEKHTANPQALPPGSEQVIADFKCSNSSWAFQTPPSSPSSLGSRKSSICSISSLNSSSSGSSKSHHSSTGPQWQRSLSQVSNISEHSGNSSSSSTPCSPFPAMVQSNTSTWPNLQETLQFERAASAIINERPHTISSAYEKSCRRTPLTVYTFKAPEESMSQPVSPVAIASPEDSANKVDYRKSSSSANTFIQNRPQLPQRSSSLEKSKLPTVPVKNIALQGVRVLPPAATEHNFIKKPTYLPSHLSKDLQPTYANLKDLSNTHQESALPSKNNRNEKDASNLGGDTGRFEVSSESVSQPTSTTEESHYKEGAYQNTLTRRSSSMVNKPPPPPIRRTSSITSNSGQALASAASLEHLPHPPPFLLEPSGKEKSITGVNVAETVKVLTELRHTPASPNALRKTQSTVSPLQNTNLSSFSSPNRNSYIAKINATVYAEPSTVTTASSLVMQRICGLRSQSADRKSEGVEARDFLATLNSRLTPNSSPRFSRRFSEDNSTPNTTDSVVTSQKGPGQTFLKSLNAKLAQQHLSNSMQSHQVRVTKIRQLFNSKAQPDPKVCHESLMDQIRKGATLKRTKMVNDRSAPKIC